MTNLRTDIRQQLSFLLPAGLTEDEWKKICEKVEKIVGEERERIIVAGRKRYRCGACDNKISNLAHTHICMFLSSLTLNRDQN